MLTTLKADINIAKILTRILHVILVTINRVKYAYSQITNRRSGNGQCQEGIVVYRHNHCRHAFVFNRSSGVDEGGGGGGGGAAPGGKAKGGKWNI